jgi:hypothetical protein
VAEPQGISGGRVAPRRSRWHAFLAWVALGLLLVVTAPANAATSRAGEEVDGEPTSLEQAIAFRTTFGLQANAAFVQASLDSPKDFPNHMYGVPLSLAEAADMDHRTDVQFAVDPAIIYAVTLPESGGAYMDQLHGGEPVFLTTGDVEAFRSKVDPLVPDEIAFRVEKVAFSRAELNSIRDKVAASFKSLQEAGLDVHSVGIKVSTNSVLVGVRGLDEAATERLVQQFGPAISTREDPTRHLDACTSRVVCPPLKGGIKIYETNHTTNICTAGFIVKLEGTTTLRVLTAGHCIELSVGQIGAGWSHNGTQFGTAKTETWGQGSDADAGLMSVSGLTGDRNLVYASSSSDIRHITGYLVNSAQNEGDGVCRSGRTTLYLCGEIVVEDATFDVDGKDIDHQWEVNFDASPGDSGASMIWANSALGIHTDSTAADPPGGHGWYSPFGWVLTKLNNYGTPITLCWTTTCQF